MSGSLGGREVKIMKSDLDKTPRMRKNGMIRNTHIVTHTFYRIINNAL